MKNHISILIILFFTDIAYAQHYFKDINSLKEISFVEIYSENGSMIGISDESGLINNGLMEKIIASNSKKLFFSNQSYLNQEMDIDLFKITKTILLIRNIINLEEVVIEKRNDYKYLKLNGYFRSSQTYEDSLQFFNDGIIEYYISLKSRKIKMNVLANRSFENKKIKQVSNTYKFSVVGVPTFNNFTNEKALSNEYEYLKDEQKLQLINKKNRQNSGNVSIINNLAELQLSIYSDKNPKIMKLFGMESNLNLYNISAIYDCEEISDINLNTIKYYKEVRNYNLKKNSKENFKKIEAIHEFFLLDAEMVEKIEPTKFARFYTFIDQCNYSEIFWLNIKSQFFKPLPLSVNNYIEKNMTEIKKED